MSDNLEPKNNNITAAEYRTRLLNKLNTLIAVLEVAISKISRTADLSPDRAERLLKIRTNLENTLAICRRARTTLEGRSADGQMPTTQAVLPAPTPRAARHDAEKMTYRDYVEFQSVEEYRKFKTLPPITGNDIKTADIENLIGRLQGF